MSDTTETETDTNTDNTDEPSKAELHDRVQQLESTVAKMMPSRRDALRMGAAGLAGAAGLGATSGSAAAATGSAGQIGDSNNRPDVFADTVDANQLSGVSTGGDRQGCRVFLSNDQSIAQDNRVKIQFDSTVYDSDNNFDTSSHNWTCPKDGLYMANLQVQFNGGSNDQTRQVTIGTATDPVPSDEGAFNQQNSSDSSDNLFASTINKHAQGDTIAAYVQNKNSGDGITTGAKNFQSFLEVAFLGGF